MEATGHGFYFPPEMGRAHIAILTIVNLTTRVSMDFKLPRARFDHSLMQSTKSCLADAAGYLGKNRCPHVPTPP